MRPLIRTRLIARHLQPSRQIRPHNRNIIREPRHRLEELPKQVKDAHALHDKPHERPAQQYERDAGPEGGAAPPFLPPGEEDEGPLGAEEERYSDEEEDVAHGEEGAVEEEEEAEEEEEDAAGGEGDAEFCGGEVISWYFWWWEDLVGGSGMGGRDRVRTYSGSLTAST